MIGTPAMAHHSVNAEFDTTKELTFTGVLTKIDNVNPHSWWYVDVKADDGKVTNWKLESVGPGGLVRQGLRLKDDLKMGQEYTFKVSPGWKDDPSGAKIGFMKTITVNGKLYTMTPL
jgi:hypothetical protein